ncbi:hypothetical protein BV98_000033 [Sphingobium herbicidovorans NBRC 16415]|uniref:Uncharacterized protein n=1 Tax=Sphingobium herbicidovorans (strain ATCC 700291 / DSM 11019 / CCUG 56400 / KCTC 2939 / LMG 18315 / NBRC 16415 / MH) TaxID=1219045 RepID=A0A086PEG7_SPHHM|nr:hypothetical protein [Sphingobium herbicidovorans]KFG91785.1 hypothetical protein BV98_000033 [Sphingobium herbicidovorans NBRC 16415]
MKTRFRKKPGSNRPVDRIRDSGGKVQIAPEHGKIVCMKSIGDRLYLLAERGVVSGEMADGIDPKRTNEAIPPFVQRTELSYGVDHTFIQQTLCVAFQLLDHTYLPDTVDDDEARAHALDAAIALAAIADVMEEMKAHQNETRIKLQTHEFDLGHLPRTANIRGKLHGCISHLREVEMSLAKLTLMFHSKVVHNDPWQKAFRVAIAKKHGENSEEVEYLERIFTFLRSAVEHRNAMIHPKATHKVVLHDYAMRPDGAFWAPSLEIVHPEFPLDRQDAVQFFTNQLDSMGHAFETALSCLCNVNAMSFNEMFDTSVARLPEGEPSFGSRLVWNTVVRPEYADSFPQQLVGAKQGTVSGAD